MKATSLLLSLATALTPAALQAQVSNGAVPGTLNFVQGQVNIDGQMIASAGSGANARLLATGQTLATSNGSADLLMARGALLRVGSNATVQMVAATPDRTEVRLTQGLLNVSVHQVRKDDLLLIDLPHGQTQLVSSGLYSFNAAEGTVRVFGGEALAFEGEDTDAAVKPEKIKDGHMLVLGEADHKPEKFDREDSEADLLPWTGPAESQAVLADSGLHYGHGEGYAGNAGYYGPAGYGFYGGGYGFGDPFLGGLGGYGYGFGPYGLYGYPFFGVGYGFYGGGGYYRPYGGWNGGRIPHGFAGNVGGYQGGRIPHGFSNGGFRGGGAPAFHGGGGGFHGGGGGFHGGGGGHR